MNQKIKPQTEAPNETPEKLFDGLIAKDFHIRERTRKIAFWCIMAVILFARFYAINSVPGDINQDEAFAGYQAYTLGHTGKDSYGNVLPMFFVAWGSGMNVLESYLSIPFIALFGTHAWVIRFIPAVFAVLALAAIYTIFRKTTNDVFALFALFFAGIMPWHIMLSRCAIETNLAASVLIFAFYFYVKGLENDRYLLYSAICYGLSLYACATLWIFLPFLLLFEVLYLIYQKILHKNKYTIGSAVILGISYLPVLLFVMVNHGLMKEIKLPFLTIPKLVYYRGSEISFSEIPKHLKNLWNIFRTQYDGFPWNTTETYGLIYKISLPFTLVGLIYMLIMAIRKLRKKQVSIEFLWLLQFFMGMMVGILIQVNVNRINMLFLPMICMTAYGLYVIFAGISQLERFKDWNYYLLLVPVLAYTAFFSHFESYYFTGYRDMMHGYFSYGLDEVMNYAMETLEEDANVYVTPNASYARILFYGKENLKEYLTTVDYTNYPAPFLDVSGFGRFLFSVDQEEEPDGFSAYIVDSSYNDSILVRSMNRNGYTSFSAGNYTVWYLE